MIPNCENGHTLAIDANTFPRNIDSLSYIAIALTDVFRRHYNKRHGPKALATHGRVSYRTALNWLSGRTSPEAQTLILLMRENRAVRDDVLRLVGDTECGNGR